MELNYRKIAILLVGGKSSRMGTDKFLLELNGKPQWVFMVEELSGFFDSVYISCRSDQAHHFPNQKLIIDPAESVGPMGGIVQAFSEIENVEALFFVGCDLPNFRVEITETLYAINESTVDVCAAQSSRQDYPEPLVAIWNRNSVPELKKRIESGDFALFKCMSSLRVKTVPIAANLLKNVNRPEDL